VPEYVLEIRLPRGSATGSVAFSKGFLRVSQSDDMSATRWARRTAPRRFAFVLAGTRHHAIPVALWRVQPPENPLIWTSKNLVLLSRHA
jgi:hypothetical protein